MEYLLSKAKDLDEPVLIHILTKKGKGYKPAEENPDRFHATGPFNVENGETKKEKTIDYSSVFGDKLIKLAEKNKNIVAITAAMKDGTGLREFANKYPERFFDVGIAEQHAITFAAGLAKEGMIPVVPIYSSFYQRCYDQVIHDVCMQNLHVVMCVDRAGIVGADGETHQGILDFSFFKIIPNIKILAPKDFKEFEMMLEYAVNEDGPIVIRYPRGGEGKYKFENYESIENENAEIIKNGDNVTILAIGKMVSKAMEVSKELEKNKINVEVVNVRFLKPLDKNKIMSSILKTKNVITIEDNSLGGGLSTSIKELIIENNMRDIKIESFGYPDEFIKHGTVDQIEKIYGLDSFDIAEKIIKMINEKNEVLN